MKQADEKLALMQSDAILAAFGDTMCASTDSALLRTYLGR